MLKKLMIVIVLLGVIAAGDVVFAYQEVMASLSQPVTTEQKELITVKPGTSFRSLLNQLEKQGIIPASQWYRWIGHVEPELLQLKAGSYLVEPKMTLQQLLTLIGSGKEHQFSITLVEGERFSEWLKELQQAPEMQHKTVGLSEAEIAKALNIDTNKLEGYMLPETYNYTAGMSDLDILKRAHNKLESVLENAWQGREKELPLKTPYDVLIMASIIEKETAVDSERDVVSSVFTNRLEKGMRLQTDPTVIYGMGDKYDGNIRKRDLTTPTPYNTYVIFGLPPTPIAMPSKASILAAVHPAQTKYLYFVANGKGGHTFSKTLAEHNRAVRQYLRTLRNK
ncbi:putative aminodeoxychorismate lyase [Photobacterium damselae subsp. piscicida]|uniref:Endolytic murein transglycosylase n=1 Tax=Photobacterium damsela subsp. piscicida TaxID=38294 RepID=A0A1V1V468_PHODP|nr:endolytic transglycosylase MltG [Photobacterium damselae]MBE8128839.1 endolytic transglycosylase MltG [Photobacterium damselae subsp. piscicida]MDP2514706.1 endolytic transglycosylase MltG [Photobacterium damselae subsp. piscicida]PSV79404.1 endolytic transglycosylase MltG [Photobacterium damselae]PSW84706.1 endolytic transglycosylase MltG [Photobacterium damselae]QOD53529.1 endolytic transglycosylase MltG [Photobacterium damselae subsp. piscicida]